LPLPVQGQVLSKPTVLELSDNCLTHGEGEVGFNVKVVGCGGGGSNTVHRCAESGVRGVQMCAMDTDVHHLLRIRAPRKMLIGLRSAGRMGTGSCPDVGERAARENENDIRNFLLGSRVVFVAASLGGGTGTGSAPVVAGISREMGALTVGMATMPFSSEGKHCAGIARVGLTRLRKTCDATFVIPNDRILEQYPTMPIEGAFMQADTVLTTAINGVIRRCAMPGDLEVDHTHILTTILESGATVEGIGKKKGTGSRQSWSRGFIVKRFPRR